ncbi:TolC family protein [Nitratiruptor sp. SB155-2]|uniref:TolC family protein n=1 Tax=Nitratiruptor sp. (strain SB155-2) TaxID=387092 RepID=UPI0001586EE4|nr:TolC family protein [Nitratiruptor sp. SB155-2]BAF69231.1 outer membrane efflux protein [Nitratiruptor sp. SB155-2]
MNDCIHKSFKKGSTILKKTLQLLVLMSLFAISLSAKTLSLQECIDKALKNYPDVKTGRFKAEQAKKDISLQKSSYLPQLSLSAEYDLQRTYVMPQAGQFHTIDNDGWSVGMQVRQKIYDFSQTTNLIKSSKMKKEIAKLRFKDTKALLRYRVKMIYALLLVQKEALEAREKDLLAKKALYHQAQALYAQGLKTQADVHRFYASVKEAEDALAQARADYKKSIATLEALTGLHLSTNIVLDSGILMQKFEVSKDLHTLLSNNLQTKIAQKDIQATALEAKAAKNVKWGSIDALAQISHVKSLSSYDTTLLGIQYSLPLYTGGKLSAQAQKAKIATLIAKERTESIKRSIIEEHKKIMADLEEIESRIEAQKAQERALIETKKLLNARYKVGLTTYIEVLDAQAAWLHVKLGLLNALYQRAASIFKLEYLNGK